MFMYKDILGPAEQRPRKTMEEHHADDDVGTMCGRNWYTIP